MRLQFIYYQAGFFTLLTRCMSHVAVFALEIVTALQTQRPHATGNKLLHYVRSPIHLSPGDSRPPPPPQKKAAPCLSFPPPQLAPTYGFSPCGLHSCAAKQTNKQTKQTDNKKAPCLSLPPPKKRHQLVTSRRVVYSCAA